MSSLCEPSTSFAELICIQQSGMGRRGGKTWRSMRRESKPLRYIPIVCLTKEAMPRSICPALVLLVLLALLASCSSLPAFSTCMHLSSQPLASQPLLSPSVPCFTCPELMLLGLLDVLTTCISLPGFSDPMHISLQSLLWRHPLLISTRSALYAQPPCRCSLWLASCGQPCQYVRTIEGQIMGTRLELQYYRQQSVLI